MTLVVIKGKHQVTIPVEIRAGLNLEIGDFLEAKVEENKITLTPMKVVDRGPASLKASADLPALSSVPLRAS